MLVRNSPGHHLQIVKGAKVVVGEPLPFYLGCTGSSIARNTINVVR